MDTRRILIDVTDYRSFRLQHRRLTGIQRVIFEVGRRLLAAGHLDVVCFFYDQTTDEFYVADPALLETDDFSIDRDKSDGVRSRIRANSLGAARRAWRYAGPLKRWLGRSRSARHVFATARRVLKGEPKPVEIFFMPEDVVLILGTVWESPRLLARIASERNSVGFSVATMVYDLIPVDFPQFVFSETIDEFTRYLRWVLASSDVILVISEATKDILETWTAEQEIVPPPIHVTYLGDDFSRPAVATRPSSFPEGDFVLSVSTVEPRKNHYLLYQAAKYAKVEGIELPRIIIAGRPGWKTADLQDLLTNDPSIQNDVAWMDRVDDSELAWLYENALFTLFPSIAEGWGLPISESIYFGKFCVASNLSSMPEIAGDLIDYASPYDPASWARIIHRYFADRNLLEQRETRIRGEYHVRRWDDTAQRIESALALLPRRGRPART